ncbi:hypothetical protein M8C21_027337 [Ambrosia artemisiifolia]|uniref:Protein kinase domain-containing protein n=1 Tax=Ambrosia artemisiifolia TaxID=4212 RepID=A0AAD5GNM5_AMBAR|nr:hypothetical protein M8C21_027337 [Ambrosia artemisiifolia]
MELLDLSLNKINGSIPNDLFLLKNLTEVYLYENNIVGGIPDSIEAMNMQIIDLSANKLTGKIPDGFGNLLNLKNLSLMTNQLSGEVPAGIARLPNLNDMRIFNNNLSGTFSPDFGRYTDLKIFDVAQNNFTGTLPENLCYKGQLKGLDVYENNLFGEIPKSLRNCSSLKSFQVYRNRFSGSIPDGLWKVSRLEKMIVHSNLFSGELPHELGPILSLIDISNNSFYGRIPSGVSSWTNLAVFKASDNLLSGVIPQELTTLPNLLTLFLDGNRLTGELPTTIVSWGSLNTLNLSRNQLTGQIPVGLGLLAALTSLDFSRFETRSSRKISGRILVIIASIVVVLLLLVVLIIGYVAVHYKRRKYDLEWKFTSFQKLNFTETTILPQLTENNVIGHGGSGKVYRIPINRSGDFVAVKKISNNTDLDQGLEKEFLTEIEILTTIRHSNIVKLLGCISCDNTKLLVYEYLENRSLDYWLHQKRVSPSHGLSGSMHLMVIDWPKRLHIALGVANEYAHTIKVNEKIDVYSFGVILLELTTGKEASNGNENSSLAEWAWQQGISGTPILDALDDEVMEPRYVDDMTNVFKLGLWCTSKLPTNRPSLQEVCQMLRRCSIPATITMSEEDNNGGDMVDHLPLLKLENV